MKTITPLRKNPCLAVADGRCFHWLKAGCLLLVAGLYIALPAKAQTTITQNNLIQNASFDSGGTGWSTSAGGTYYYTTTVGSESDSIMSMGWYDGAGFWQNTGATIQPGLDYVLTIRALVGSSPLTGVKLSFQDVTAGWTEFTNKSFTFPDQTETWRVFSMYVPSNKLSGAVGDTMGIAGGLVENPNNQYGWLWVDWLQLAPALPYFTSQPVGVTNYAGASAAFSSAAIGAVTNSTGPGSVITYQWYLAGNPLAHATNTSYSIPVLNATNAGIYYVVATSPYGSTQSSNVTLAVLPVMSATTLSLTSSAPTNGYQAPVTFTAAVQTNGVTSGNASGYVLFKTNSVIISSNNIVSGGSVSSAAISNLPRGTNVITAVYSGDANYLASTATLNQIVTNHPPVATSFMLGALSGTSITMPVIGGKYAPTDFDGDALSVSTVQNPSAQGGTVSTDGTNVSYTALGSFTGSDTFTYTVSDGNGGFATATITANVVSNGQGYNLISGPANIGGGQSTITYAGIPGYNYALDTTTSLVLPVTWTPVVTNVANSTNGILKFTFSTGNGSGYFRTRYVP